MFHMGDSFFPLICFVREYNSSRNVVVLASSQIGKNSMPTPCTLLVPDMTFPFLLPGRPGSTPFTWCVLAKEG